MEYPDKNTEDLERTSRETEKKHPSVFALFEKKSVTIISWAIAGLLAVSSLLFLMQTRQLKSDLEDKRTALVSLESDHSAILNSKSEQDAQESLYSKVDSEVFKLMSTQIQHRNWKAVIEMASTISASLPETEAAKKASEYRSEAESLTASLEKSESLKKESEKKASEEKASREKANKVWEKSEFTGSFSYEQLMAEEGSYTYQENLPRVVFSGTVFQVISNTKILVAMNGNTNQLIMVHIAQETPLLKGPGRFNLSARPLNDGYNITVWGKTMTTESYRNMFNSKKTVPAVQAYYMEY